MISVLFPHWAITGSPLLHQALPPVELTKILEALAHPSHYVILMSDHAPQKFAPSTHHWFEVAPNAFHIKPKSNFDFQSAQFNSGELLDSFNDILKLMKNLPIADVQLSESFGKLYLSFEKTQMDKFQSSKGIHFSELNQGQQIVLTAAINQKFLHTIKSHSEYIKKALPLLNRSHVRKYGNSRLQGFDLFAKSSQGQVLSDVVLFAVTQPSPVLKPPTTLPPPPSPKAFPPTPPPAPTQGLLSDRWYKTRLSFHREGTLDEVLHALARQAGGQIEVAPAIGHRAVAIHAEGKTAFQIVEALAKAYRWRTYIDPQHHIVLSRKPVRAAANLREFVALSREVLPDDLYQFFESLYPNRPVGGHEAMVTQRDELLAEILPWLEKQKTDAIPFTTLSPEGQKRTLAFLVAIAMEGLVDLHTTEALPPFTDTRFLSIRMSGKNRNMASIECTDESGQPVASMGTRIRLGPDCEERK